MPLVELLGGSNHREHREHRNYVKAFDTEIGEDAPRGTENYGKPFFI
jgi:hypothetical protein